MTTGSWRAERCLAVCEALHNETIVRADLLVESLSVTVSRRIRDQTDAKMSPDFAPIRFVALESQPVGRQENKLVLGGRLDNSTSPTISNACPSA